MKYSLYNHFVEMENVVLCFNAYNYSRLIIGKNAYQDYLSCKDNVEKAEFNLQMQQNSD